MLVFFCLLHFSFAQNYKDYRERIDNQLKSYRENVECEQKVAQKLRNLKDLMQITPDRPEIIKSCNFLNSNKDGSCPQPDVRKLAVEIKKAYLNGEKESEIVAQDSSMNVANKDSLTSPEISEKPTESAENQTTENSVSNYITYASLVSLVLLCLFLMYRLNQVRTALANLPRSTPHQHTSQPLLPVMNEEILERLNADISKLKEENNWLRREFGRMNSQINGLLEMLEDTIRRVNGLDAQQPNISMPAPFVEPEKPSSQDTAPTTPIFIPAAQDMRYALYMDNSEGFSTSGLMQFANSETIYEIVLQSERNASYRIFNNHDAQQYALTDPSYYLRTACEYENSPTLGKRIDTISEGMLENTGSVWKIMKKAKIRFV
ncbi:MAG: hypothetical protein ACKVTZ_01930 [Bacteroidia bacterium]